MNSEKEIDYIKRRLEEKAEKDHAHIIEFKDNAIIQAILEYLDVDMKDDEGKIVLVKR